MARLPRRLVRQRTAGGNGKDRLSALPDELIHLIVSRLDTRTALSTAVLGRRWARIPRDLPALDLRVSDILPAEYHRTFAFRQGKSRRVQELAGELDNLLALFEDIMMESLAAGITRLLEADGHGGGSDGDGCRRVKTVRLDFFFRTHDDVGCIERLIAAAVGAWGVEDLEVVAYPSATCHDHDAPAYGFPHDRLDGGGRSRLRSLTLGNCTLPPLRTYEALRTLVLQGVAASTPVAVYERLFTDCARLQTLHLKSCGCAEELDHLEVDAPCSSLTELVVEDCAFSAITLHDLPALTRLACQDSSASVMLTFGSVPSLTHVNLTFWGSEKPHDFLGNAPDAITSLVLRFTGPVRWVLPRHVATPFRGLKRLLVADVPPNWDVSWPRILLLSARSLEALHIHVALAHSDEEEEPGEEIIWWQRPRLRHRHMKELVMVGFTGTPRQTQYLRDLVKVCRSLQRLVLLRDGHVQYNGLWDWKMVGKQQECPRRRRWSDDDEMAVKRMIKSRSRAHLEVILG